MCSGLFARPNSSGWFWLVWFLLSRRCVTGNKKLGDTELYGEKCQENISYNPYKPANYSSCVTLYDVLCCVCVPVRGCLCVPVCVRACARARVCVGQCACGHATTDYIYLFLLSTYKLERQFFRTGRRIAPKFCTHVRIDTLTLKKIDPPHPRGAYMWWCGDDVDVAMMFVGGS